MRVLSARLRQHAACAFLAPLLALMLLSAGCGGGSSRQEEANEDAIPQARSGPVSTNKDDYPVFPDPDAGADPNVPAEQGGKGFKGEGWETNTSFDLIGDPHALKGGVFRLATSDFPSTLRPEGPNITSFNSVLRGLVYESLLGLHPTTLDYIPALATHWQISPDKMTYRFRINPNARWADGQPVVADDVVATWMLWMDKSINDPTLQVVYGKFEKPVAESKYIVRVRSAKPNWRNFLYFSTMEVLPAHVIRKLDGASFVRDYNYKMVPGSGPYAVSEQDVEKGKAIHIRRRKDYWAEKQRRNVGTGNFDEIRFTVVRDRNLEFEMFKRGDLDLYNVNRAQMWEEELNFDAVRRGLILKRRIWNHAPQGLVGFPMNTRRAPLDDVRVRKALALLFNREGIIKSLMYNAYTPADSLFPGTIWENPTNEKIRYNPEQALKLLAEAGFKTRDAQGRLTRNGVPLTIEMLNDQKDAERFLTIYQNDLRKVGITLNLRLVTFETYVKLLDERQFDMGYGGYTAGLFPDEESRMLSSLADVPNTNNITGFKNKRVDELLAQYDLAYEIPERVKIMREIDKIYTDAHHWVLYWYAPYERLAFWNKFGAPKGYYTRVGDFSSGDPLALWWIDPDKYRKLEEARRNGSIDLGQGEVDDKYWLEFDKQDTKNTLYGTAATSQ